MEIVHPPPPSAPAESWNVVTHAKVATTVHWIASIIVMIYCFVCVWYYVLVLLVFSIVAFASFIYTTKGRSYFLLTLYIIYCCLYEILSGVALAIAVVIANGSARGVNILSASDDDDYYDYDDEVPHGEKVTAKIGIAFISIMLVFTVYELVMVSLYMRYLRRQILPVGFVTTQILQLQPYPQNQFPAQNPLPGQNQVLLQPGQVQYYPPPYTPQPATSYTINGVSTVAHPTQGLPAGYVLPGQPVVVQPAPQN